MVTCCHYSPSTLCQPPLFLVLTIVQEGGLIPIVQMWTPRPREVICLVSRHTAGKRPPPRYSEPPLQSGSALTGCATLGRPFRVLGLGFLLG